MVNKKFSSILRKQALLNSQSLKGQRKKAHLAYQMTFLQLCSAASVTVSKCKMSTMALQQRLFMELHLCVFPSVFDVT